MKTKIIIQILTALVLSACSSSYFAKSGNDDLYYTPSKGSNIAQAQPETANVAVKKTTTVNQQSNQQVTDYEKYRKSLEEGELADTSVNPAASGRNYADNPTVQNPADLKEPIVQSEDYYGDGSDTYVYNNYYYASRLNRFHGGFYDPYFYDPYFYNSWYDPFYSPGWNFSIGFGWGSPYYYDPYYYPYYGGYWGYYGYNPYWHGYYNHGYYDGYNYGGYYNGIGDYGSNRRYGRIPNRSGLTNGLAGRGGVGGSAISGSREKSTRIVNPNAPSRGNYGTSQSGRRYGTDNTTISRPTYTRRVPAESGVNQGTRRYSTDNQGSVNGGRTEYRGNAGNTTRTYTPSYSKPRTYSRPTYNESSSSGNYSGNRESSSSQNYSRPRSSSNTSSGSSYTPSRSSSSGSSSGGSYRPSYTPSSSSSSGGSYSSGSSGRSSSGGSSSGSSSSSGGRRR